VIEVHIDRVLMHFSNFLGSLDKAGEVVTRLKVDTDGNVFCGIGRDGMVGTGSKMGWVLVLEKNTPGGFAVVFLLG
jgi:hypothetical protein